MDETIRNLEREAALGDPDAVEKLKVGYYRLAFGGDVQSCVKLDALYRRAEEWDEMNALRAHCLKTDAWVPTKGEPEYGDAELEKTPVFGRLRQILGGNATGVKLPTSTVLTLCREAWRLRQILGGNATGVKLPTSTVLTLCRDLREMWTATLHARQAELHEVNGEWTIVFPVVCTRCNARVNERCTTESGNYRSYPHHARTNCDFHPIQQTRRRFSHANYAQCIDYDEGHGPGIFRIQKTGMKQPRKDGWYELRVLPSQPIMQGGQAVENEVCSQFRIELHQSPEDHRKLPVIRFPPVSGDKKKLVITEDIREVASMSQVMRYSELRGAQTPAVMFSLVDAVRQIEEGPD